MSVNTAQPAGDNAGARRQSRRRFLRNTALAAASLVPASLVPAASLLPASALGRDGTVAPSNRIALGVIGTSQGMVNVSRCLPFADVTVSAACDIDAQRLERAALRINAHYAANVCKPWHDFREMFTGAALDAVIIATPDHWHGTMAVAALRHGIDVFGEKPLAHTLAEGRAVCDAVGQHGRIWQSGCWQRSVPAFRRAAELIRAGALGAVVRAEVGTYGGSPEARPVPDDYDKPPAHLDYARWVGPAAWTPYDSRVTHLRWRYVSNYGGGRLMDFVGHHLDIAHWALGLDATGPLAVAGTGTLAAHAPYDTEDVYTAECEYAGGLRIVISSEFTPGVKFFAADGNWLQVGRGRGINGAAFLHTSRPEILNAAVPESMRLYRSDNHWRNFIDCVKTRRPTIAPAEAGQRSTSVGHLAHIAIQLGRKLHWNPATEQFLDDPSANALLLPAHRA